MRYSAASYYTPGLVEPRKSVRQPRRRQMRPALPQPVNTPMREVRLVASSAAAALSLRASVGTALTLRATAATTFRVGASQ